MSAHTATKKVIPTTPGKAAKKFATRFALRADAAKTRMNITIKNFDSPATILNCDETTVKFIPTLEPCEEDVRVTPMDHRGRPMTTSTDTPIVYIDDSESEDDQQYLPTSPAYIDDLKPEHDQQFSPYSPTTPAYPI
jgi:hypothetical protein